MIVSRPCSASATLPDTGASSSSAPRARAAGASDWATRGSTVLISSSTLPCRTPSSTPAGPR